MIRWMFSITGFLLGLIALIGSVMTKRDINAQQKKRERTETVNKLQERFENISINNNLAEAQKFWIGWCEEYKPRAFIVNATGEFGMKSVCIAFEPEELRRYAKKQEIKGNKQQQEVVELQQALIDEQKKVIEDLQEQLKKKASKTKKRVKKK